MQILANFWATPAAALGGAEIGLDVDIVLYLQLQQTAMKGQRMRAGEKVPKVK
jgi:hypothetical protein